jgi:uncharacterized protein
MDNNSMSDHKTARNRTNAAAKPRLTKTVKTRISRKAAPPSSPRNKKVDSEIDTAHEELRKLLGARYSVAKHIGRGGAGIVFKITDIPSGVERVGKILSPSARLAKEHARIAAEFRGEAKKLAHLHHPNLVTVFEQSTATEIPYFVMEFAEGEEFQKVLPPWARRHPGGHWTHKVREVFLQLAEVLDYLHTYHPPLLHLDLKPENVKVTEDHRKRPVAKLLDFGISRFEDIPDPKSGEIRTLGTFRMWPTSYLKSLSHKTESNRTVFLIDRKKVNVHLDLHLLGATVAEALEIGKTHDTQEMDSWNRPERIACEALAEIVGRLNIDHAPHPQRFSSAGELAKALRKLEFPTGRVSGQFDTGFVRIPGSRIRHFGDAIRKITDLPRFQRLRGIYQLGLAHLVYPGATHTRFEHSLGVFANALEVLDHITGPLAEHRFRALVSDEELAATVLLGLLHDIGHYAFAHQFRITGQFPPHETRTLEVLQSEELRKVITQAFNKDVYESLIRLEMYIVSRDNPGSNAKPVESYPPQYQVLRDVISSTIDVDKLDYVARDALHSGVPYGAVIDQERFIVSLKVWWEAEGPCLLPSDKGRACAEALVFARYLMTSEVYWNHAVRAYAAMLSAAIDQMDPKESKKHLWDTDSQFVTWLAENRPTSWFVKLLNERKPYRRAFVHQKLGGKADVRDKDVKLFERLEKAAEESDARPGGQATLSIVREVVASTLGLNMKKLAKHEIVLDVPKGMPHLGAVRVLPEGHQEPGSSGPIFNAIGENFDGFARKARVFVHPRHQLKGSVSDTTGKVRIELLKAFGI